MIARLETLARGTPAELLLQSLEASGPIAAGELFKRASLATDAAPAALDELLTARQALRLSEGILIATSSWSRLKGKIDHELNAYHAANPLRIGMPREELKSRLGLDTKIFNLVIEQATGEDLVATVGSSLRVPNFEILFTPGQQKSIDELIRKFQSSPWATPSLKDSEQAVGADVLSALIDLGRLIKLGEEVLLLPETYRSAVQRIRIHLQANQTITVAHVRDLFGTSRKYALALMEYLDTQGVTRRVGDERVLGSKSAGGAATSH